MKNPKAKVKKRKEPAHVSSTDDDSEASPDKPTGFVYPRETSASESETELEAVALGMLPKTGIIKEYINDQEGLLACLQDFMMFTPIDPKKNDGMKLPNIGLLPFPESLRVDTRGEPLPKKLSENDLELEKMILEKTKEATERGLKMVKAANIPFRRPDDFMAEMVKSDTQMAKVKDRMIKIETDISNALERRKMREQKRKGTSKKIQVQKEMQRNKAIKDDIKALTELRKERLRERRQRGRPAELVDDDDDFPVDMFDFQEIRGNTIQKDLKSNKNFAGSAKKNAANFSSKKRDFDAKKKIKKVPKKRPGKSKRNKAK